MTWGKQSIANDTDRVMLVYFEPWTWRYRLEPGDLLEFRHGLKPRTGGSALSFRAFDENGVTAVAVWADIDIDEAGFVLNGLPATQNYEAA